MAVINEWRTSDPAKITAYEISESGDKLKQYYKICFTSVDTSLGFDDTDEYTEYVSHLINKLDKSDN